MSASFKQRTPLDEARLAAGRLVGHFLDAGLDYVAICGSIRRKKPEVGDIDLVVVGDLSRLRGDHLRWRWVEGGEKKANLEFEGRQVNVLRSDTEHLGAAVLYFTGPRGYNIGMRRLARSQGLRLNEYGLWRGDECLASGTEADIYQALGKEFRNPWEREG